MIDFIWGPGTISLCEIVDGKEIFIQAGLAPPPFRGQKHRARTAFLPLPPAEAAKAASDLCFNDTFSWATACRFFG